MFHSRLSMLTCPFKLTLCIHSHSRHAHTPNHLLQADRWYMALSWDTHWGFPLFETDLRNSGKTWTPSSKSLLLGLEQVLQTRLDIQTSSWVVFSMVVFTRIFPARTFFIPNTQSGICFDSSHKDAAHLLPISVAHENSWGAVGVKDLERRTR